MGLTEYQRKRDFQKTLEPPGTEEATADHRFVVQKHQASHLHYDFRLELDGVLKSWAVPKGPPEQAGEKRLAVAVEDHPVDYLDFEGTIPEGEYGAGTVAIWDRGSFKLQSRSDTKLEFELQGQKLRGTFALFHPSSFEVDNWLLIKK